MKILHTADLHLGQVIYQNYDRSDEHRHFFDQLMRWCKEEQPDALLVSGDVFDIQQPSSTTKKAFNDYFARLHRDCPDMHIIITAGNHDSASRIQADSSVWEFANATLIGVSPAMEAEGDWQDKYIVRLKTGYVVAMPYMIGERKNQLQSILDRIAAENKEGKPVVMMGHTAVTGLDATGHSFEIGRLKTQDAASFGQGYDYLALGHIHKPQTIGHPTDVMLEEVCYPAPVIRYSGSALHVSCDEAFPHTVSVVEMDRHGGQVKIRQLRIEELRHFYVLPQTGDPFGTADEAMEAVRQFIKEHPSGYIRLRMDYQTALPSNFNQMIYDLLASTQDEIRYNPNIVWEGKPTEAETDEKPTFEVAELQQMNDPMTFVEKTKEQYPDLDLDEVRKAFEEVKAEAARMEEEVEKKGGAV
ncbi:MAG: exonuclease SbcCD subunit D [Bacteroidales bacterium]|nr:exonuclease SbcCD subunit D [Bacteroidales bacterium]